MAAASGAGAGSRPRGRVRRLRSTPLATGHAAQLFEPAAAGRPRPTSAGRLDEAFPGRRAARAGDRGRDAGPVAGPVPGGGFRRPMPCPAPCPAAADVPVPAVLLLIGVGGDELRPQFVALRRRPRRPRRAGLRKEHAAGGAPRHEPGCDWLAPRPGTDPGQYWSGLHASALAGTLDRTRLRSQTTLICSQPRPTGPCALNSLGWTVILTAGFGPGFRQRVALAAIARSQGQGILIRPRRLMDSELSGSGSNRSTVLRRDAPSSFPTAGRRRSAGCAPPGRPAGILRAAAARTTSPPGGTPHGTDLYRAGGAPAAREAKAMTRLSNSSTIAAAAGISMASPASG